MLKNNKGYFLAETIIALTIIAAVITVIYLNSISNFSKQNIELTKYNTTQGLYSIKEVKRYLKNDEINFKNLLIANASGYIDVISEKSLKGDRFIEPLNIKNIYFMNYGMGSFLNTANIAPSIKKELKSINIEENKCKYRYLAIFKDGSYSTIGVDCNID